MVPAALSRTDRLRRVALLCESFMRNLAYSRAADEFREGWRSQATEAMTFLVVTSGNSLDVCVLEWIKLIGDRHAQQGWRKIVADPDQFEAGLLAQLGVTREQLDDYANEMKTYRDKFIAHLDAEEIMHIPRLEVARASVEFYHRHVVSVEAGPVDLAGLASTPEALQQGYDQCYGAAHDIFQRLSS